MSHPATRKLPAHKGVFSYSRIPMDGGAVVYRLFRRDLTRRVHAVQCNFHPDCKRADMAQELNIARHQLRNTVDDIDLEIMGVTQ